MSIKSQTAIICAAILLPPVTLAQSAEVPLFGHPQTHPTLQLAQQKAMTEQFFAAQYAFEMTYRDEDVQARAFVNPSRPEGQRLDVIQPARSEWDDDIRDMLTEFDAAPYDEFWCTDFLALLGSDPHPVDQDGNSIVFAFSPQPGPKDDADDRKFLAEMIAHLTIDQRTGAIQKFEMRNRRPFKPIFIAKIKSFRMEAQCQAAPDGRLYVADLSTDLTAKIALKKVKEREERSIFNLTQGR